MLTITRCFSTVHFLGVSLFVVDYFDTTPIKPGPVHNFLLAFPVYRLINRFYTSIPLLISLNSDNFNINYSPKFTTDPLTPVFSASILITFHNCNDGKGF